MPSASCLYSVMVPDESRIGIRVGSGLPSATTISRMPASFSGFGLRHDLRQRVVRLAVGHEHQHSVGRVGRGAEELSCPGSTRAARLDPPGVAMSGSSASRYIRMAPPSTVSGARM